MENSCRYPEQSPLWYTTSDHNLVISTIDHLNEHGRSITSACQYIVSRLNTALHLECGGDLLDSSCTSDEPNNFSADDEDDLLSDEEYFEDNMDCADDPPSQSDELHPSAQSRKMCVLFSVIILLSYTTRPHVIPGLRPGAKRRVLYETIILFGCLRIDTEIPTQEIELLTLHTVLLTILLSQGLVYGSVQATDRIMKELKLIYKSASYKTGVYSVNVTDDSLYKWDVYLKKVDPDSPLMGDIAKLPAESQHIHLGIIFADDFPFAPPFVRVIRPLITGGYVLSGGAICMEVLTKQGWSSAYSIESLILQISATLVKGKARIKTAQNHQPYTFELALHTFKALSENHQQNELWGYHGNCAVGIGRYLIHPAGCCSSAVGLVGRYQPRYTFSA
eukprot:sb/3465492/